MGDTTDKLSEPEEKVFDLVVIGGGAVGLMAAVWVARDGNRAPLFEKM